MPKIDSLEYIVSRRATFKDPVFDITWILTYTGMLFFCVGGGGYHSFLFTSMLEKIPCLPAQRELMSKMNSVVAAGRIKEVQGARLHLWGSKDLDVQTPEDWKPVIQEILEKQVIPQVIAACA